MKRRRILWVKKWLLRRAQLESMINANILVGKTSRKAAVVLRKVVEGLRFACGQYVPSRSSQFPYVSQLSAGFLRPQTRAEGHGNAQFIGDIFSVSCGSRTAENRGLKRISVKGVLLLLTFFSYSFYFIYFYFSYISVTVSVILLLWKTTEIENNVGLLFCLRQIIYSKQ